MQITRQRGRFSSRVVKFASQVLYSMWVHQELREVYRKAGWKEQDFVTKTIAARNARPNSPTNINSTLNRPMASQGGTRYEDRTMRAAGHGHGQGTIQAHMAAQQQQQQANNAVSGYGVSSDHIFSRMQILIHSEQISLSAQRRTHGEPLVIRTDRRTPAPGPARCDVRAGGTQPPRKTLVSNFSSHLHTY